MSVKEKFIMFQSYFSNDRFLRGLVLSKPSVPLKNEYVRLLNFYGFFPNREGGGSPTVHPGHSEGKGRPEDHGYPQDHGYPEDHGHIPITYTPPTIKTTYTPSTTVKPHYVTNPTIPTEKYTTPLYTTYDYTSKTTSTNLNTDFGTSSNEYEPTLPPYDPTKYPSKTTIYHSTNDKQKETKPTTPPYTFSDLTTVKPGYNSHGMTQFFTDHTPTEPHKHITDDDDEPTIEDNIITDDHHDKGQQQETTSPPVYKPPSHGFTDPFITETEGYFTKTTSKMTTSPYDEEESSIYYPDKQITPITKSTTVTPCPPKDTHDVDGTILSDEITFPTASTSDTSDYTGIDIRLGKFKQTTSMGQESTETITASPETIVFKGKNSDNDIAFTYSKDSNKVERTTEITPSLKLTPDQTMPDTGTTRVVTGNGENQVKVMTKEDVDNANKIVESMAKTVITEQTAATPTLATILMAVGNMKKDGITDTDLTEGSSTNIRKTEQDGKTTQQISLSNKVEVSTTTSLEGTTDSMISNEITKNNATDPTVVATTPVSEMVPSDATVNSTEPVKIIKKRSLIGPPIRKLISIF